MTKYQRDHRRTNKPKALIEEAGKLHLERKSNREISRILGVHHGIVPSLVAQSERVAVFRAHLLRQVPRLLHNFKLLTTPGTPKLAIEELGRNTRWGLEQTQVGVKREVQEHEAYDPLDALSDEEVARLRRQLDGIIRRSGLAAKSHRARGVGRKKEEDPEG